VLTGLMLVGYRVLVIKSALTVYYLMSMMLSSPCYNIFTSVIYLLTYCFNFTAPHKRL